MPNPAREASLYAFTRCRRDGAWSAAAIDAAAKKFELSRRDTAFASRLTLGTMENTALCDYYIGLFSNTPVKKLEPRVLDILRLSAYQLLFMDKVPQNAAVNEGVELCKASCPKAAGLVNAVLRKLCGGMDKLPDVAGEGTAEYLAVKFSHPLWLAEKLISERGYDFTKALFAADNEPAPLYIQVNTLKTDALSLGRLFEAEGIAVSEHPWLKDCLKVDYSGAVTALPGFKDGLFYVQDPAARCCVEAAGLRPGMTVLDACAAPGGKSFAAAIDMENSGLVVSRDIHEKKTALIKSGASRLGIGIIEASAGDARGDPGGEFDAVIADVPCSGLGVIRSKPEIRYKDREGLESLPKVQLAILESVSAGVKRGGVLMYSTCTILREENEDVIKAFLASHGGFAPEGFEVNGAVNEGMRTFWPHTDGTDGFFICKMRKHN